MKITGKLHSSEWEFIKKKLFNTDNFIFDD